jgi:hypothetical protein
MHQTLLKYYLAVTNCLLLQYLKSLKIILIWSYKLQIADSGDPINRVSTNFYTSKGE